MDFFQRLKSMGLFFGLVLVVAGLVFLLFPMRILNLFAWFAGFLLMVVGGFKGLSGGMAWSRGERRILPILAGGFMALLGLVILLNPRITVAAIGTVIGVFALLLAFDRVEAIRRRRAQGLPVTAPVLFGLIHLAFAVAMLYSAYGTMSFMVSLAGIYLFVSGIMVVLSTAYFFDHY